MKSRYLFILRSIFLFTTLILLAAGCGLNSESTYNGTGSITAKMTWNVKDRPSQVKTTAKAPLSVATVRIVIAGAGMSAMQKDFPAADGSGIIDGIPSGSGRSVKALGLDSSGLVIYQGELSNINIQAGQVTDVGIIVMLPTTLSGQVQKGPFAIGSQITVNELDESLNPTGKVYNVQTADDLGNFAVTSNFGSHLVEIMGDGFYMDELTGQLAASRIQLRAVVDLNVDATPTVNILTSLQAQRLKKLISQGSTYAAAETQSRNEILAVFGIDATKIISLSTLYSMQINGSTDADSVLLAVSAILSKMATNAAVANSTTQPAELSNYISTVAAQIANTGTITNTSTITAKNLAATQIDLAAVRTNVESYYVNRGVNVVAPKFEEWIDKDNSGSLPRRLSSTPDNWSDWAFNDITAAEGNFAYDSNVLTITGLVSTENVYVSSSSNATIIKNGLPLISKYTSLKNGDTIALRVTSAKFDHVDVNVTSSLTIGSITKNWKINTRTPRIGYAIKEPSNISLWFGWQSVSSKYFAVPFKTSTAFNAKYIFMSISFTNPRSVSIYTDNSGVPGTPIGTTTTSYGDWLSSMYGWLSIDGATTYDAIYNNWTISYGGNAAYFGPSGVPLMANTNYWYVINNETASTPSIVHFGVEQLPHSMRKISMDGSSWSDWFCDTDAGVSRSDLSISTNPASAPVVHIMN